MDLEEYSPDADDGMLPDLGIDERTTRNFRHFLTQLKALQNGDGPNRRFNDELWGKQWYLVRNYPKD